MSCLLCRVCKHPRILSYFFTGFFLSQPIFTLMDLNLFNLQLLGKLKTPVFVTLTFQICNNIDALKFLTKARSIG